MRQETINFKIKKSLPENGKIKLLQNGTANGQMQRLNSLICWHQISYSIVEAKKLLLIEKLSRAKKTKSGIWF
jgi:hypothetical protein